MRPPAHRPERRPPIRRVAKRLFERAGSEPGAPAAACALTIRNRQRTRQVDLGVLRQIVGDLARLLPAGSRLELGMFLVADAEMIRINESFLHHAGTTDVITFDYAEPETRNSQPANLHGEIFVCVDEAIRQARRFRTTWQGEIVRYLVHGVLHLLGHDDHRPPARRRMKRVENRLLRQLAARFALSRLARKTKLTA